MNFKRLIFIAVAIILSVMAGCTVKYSLSGASIPVDAKTVSVAYFPNNASMVAPTLSSTLTNALQDKFSRQTKLQAVPEGGDLAFEGEITNYISSPTAVSGTETVLRNKLTITVRVTFTNAIDPKLSYNKTFSSYEEYDATQLLQEVEGQLIEDIVKVLVEDIFNAAVSNW